MGHSSRSRSRSPSCSVDSAGCGQPASVPCTARSAGPSGALVPQLLQAAASTVDPTSPPRLLLRGEHSRPAAGPSTPGSAAIPFLGNGRLKFIVVVPSPTSQHSSSGNDDGWTAVRSCKDWRAVRSPPVRSGHPPRRPGRRPAFNADPGRRAFLNRFKSLCLRCLNPHHLRIDNRDPLHCIKCKLPGHFAKECSSIPRNRRGGGPAPERSGPAAGRGPVREWLRFPSPPVAMAHAHHTDPSRRSRSSHSVLIESPTMEHQTTLLCRHLVVLSAATKNHVASPMSMEGSIDAQLHTRPHLLRVISHDPEDFLVHFEFPAHRDKAVRLSALTVDGVHFVIKSWHKDDHNTLHDYMLHVRVVIEKMPM
ncbi:hypothetical protein VPH35_014034 [Triticum aestivum]|uniref:CCHC-type domain-containing protein n=1 Tax=Aegilops tauschii subsp. strangulata TaxID=200361 RepID=A0A452YC93_AEGTS